MFATHGTVRVFVVTAVLSAVLLAAAGTAPAAALAPGGPETGVPSAAPAPRGAQVATSQLGPELQISLPTSPECDRHQPAVAYNWRHDQYLVVWHNEWPDGHRDVYARRVSAGGELLSWFSVSAGPNDRAQPAVAYNATEDEYLVVWMYNVSGDKSTYEIWGRTIAWDGSYQNPEFQIITWPNRTFYTPRVAWNNLADEYMVVWNAFDATTFLPTDVAHAILYPDGTARYGAIISTTDSPHQVDVTYNVAADEYLAVWRQMPTVANGDVVAARIGSSSGQVVNPPGVIPVGAAPEDERSPAVTTNEQDRYVVAWEYAFPGPCCDWDILGQQLDVQGTLVSGQIYVANTIDDEQEPAVAARPGPVHDYLFTWQRDTTAGMQIWAERLGASDFEYLEIATAAFWNQKSPALAWGHIGALIAYEGDAAGDPTVYQHIYGRRWVPEVLHLPLVIRH
jgi:hypothetical protein